VLRALKARLEGGSSETGAAPVVIAAKLAAASRIEPLQYGDDLTGLSAIYAVTNAVRLGIGPYRQLTAGEVHTLIAAGFEFLSARLTPSQVFHAGCRVSVWRSMSQAMVEAARQRLGINLAIERVIVEPRQSRLALFAAIEQSILHWRPVAMLCRGGRYTVVSGFTPSSLLLFDGAGACWLSKHACGVPGDAENARHLLLPGSLMALRA